MTVEEGMGYDEKGHILGYEEKIQYNHDGSLSGDDFDMTIITVATDLTYDAFERESGGIRNEHVYGVEANRISIDVKRTITIVRLSETVEGSDSLLNRSDFEADVNFHRKWVAGYRDTKTTQGWDNLTGGELVRWLVEENTTRSDITRGGFLETKHTQGIYEDGTIGLDATLETWQGQRVFDAFGRVIAYAETTTKNGNPASESSRFISHIQYDVDGNISQNHETVTNFLGAVTETDRVNMTYDQQARLRSYELNSISTSEGDDITTTSAVVRDDISYNGLDDIVAYHEVAETGGSDLFEEINWTGGYNLFGQLAQSHQETIQWMLDEEGNSVEVDVTVTETYNLTYTIRGEMNGYIEETNSASAPDLLVITTMEDLIYDEFGHVAGFRQVIRNVSDGGKLARDGDAHVIVDKIEETAEKLHSIKIVERRDATFNALGFLTGYTEEIHEVLTGDGTAEVPDTGVVTLHTVSDITYTSQGRMNGSTTLTQTTGTEPHIVYEFEGHQLTEIELMALLEDNPEKTLDDLIVEGVLAKNRTVQEVDEETITVRSGMDYDGYNRLIGYSDATYGVVETPDGTLARDEAGLVVINTVSGMFYGPRGQVDAMATEVTQTGPVTQLVYQLNGEEITSVELVAILDETGLSLWDLFQGESAEYSLEVVEVETMTDHTSKSDRTKMEYNGLGQLVSYTDSAKDAENGIKSQQTEVLSVTYNYRGQIVTRVSKSTTIYENGSVSYVPETILVHEYDGETGQLMGAFSSGTFISTDTPVWTDTNGDGKIDGLVNLNATTGRTYQYFTVRAGQIQSLFQTTSSIYTAPDGGITTSQNTTVYAYDKDGRLMGAYSSGKSNAVDPFVGSVAETQSAQLMTVIQGALRTMITTQHNQKEDDFGTTETGVNVITYVYDTRGLGLYGLGSGIFESKDEFDFVTTGTRTQLYLYIANQFRLVNDYTKSDTTDEFGEGGEGEDPPAGDPADSLGDALARLYGDILGDDWVDLLVGLPFIVAWEIQKALFVALDSILHFTIEDIDIAEDTGEIEDVFRSSIQAAINQILGEGGGPWGSNRLS